MNNQENKAESQPLRVRKVYPEHYAAYGRRFAKAVTREDLRGKIHFNAMRAMELDEEGRIKDFNKELDLYTRQYKLGEILWLFYKFLYAPNLKAFVDEVERRGLYIFDIWGYVPGSFGDRSSWGEFEVPPEAADYLRERLGNRFLGFDNGEQDGRYIGAYAPLVLPVETDRRRLYEHFQRHFEQLGNHFDHHTIAMCSLTFGHYFAKEGNAVLLGAETAQALINANVWYAYLRGAGKQYGLLWFGNASIWNRFGYKDYERQGEENGYEFGPDCGTSLSLLRRLLYVEYMYNCEILGLEWGYTVPDPTQPTGTSLTPIGQLQADAVAFVEERGAPGTMYTPVALLMDFHNGWAPPRHLYTHEYYKVWGSLPYGAGDYQTHALFGMLFPGYENSGFYRDERGFLTPAPYGEMADVLFSDAASDILADYRLIVLTGAIVLDAELLDKLSVFVEQGGHLIATADALAKAGLAERERAEAYALCGIRSLGALRRHSSEEGPVGRHGDWAAADGADRTAEAAFEAYEIEALADAEVVAALSGKDRPLIVRSTRGEGRVSFIASPFGLNADMLHECVLEERETKYLVGPDIVTEKLVTAVDNKDGLDIPMYYDLLTTVKDYIGHCVRKEQIVGVTNPELQCIVSCREDGTFLAAVVNNGPVAQGFEFREDGRGLTVVEEWTVPALADADKLPGYYAKEFGSEGRSVEVGSAEAGGIGEVSSKDGHLTDLAGRFTVDPADIRIFRLAAADGTAVQVTGSEPQTQGDDPAAGAYLSYRGEMSLKRLLLARPTLQHHFEGIKLDASYFMEKDKEWLATEAAFVKRRGAEVIVDFTGLLNHYPDLSLLDNLKDRYEANMRKIAATFEKAALYGCTKALFILHRNAENHISAEEAAATMERSLRRISAEAAAVGIAVYLQNGTKGRLLKSTDETVAFVSRLRDANLKFVYNVGHSLALGENPAEIVERHAASIDGLLLSAPGRDDYGQHYAANFPVSGSAYESEIRGLLQSRDSLGHCDFICWDGAYRDWNEAYRDRRA